MRFNNRVWKTLGAVVVVVLAACIVYQQRSGPELTIGTVNNADMILMQRLSKEFERATPGVPYTSPTTGAWTRPGAKLGPFTAKLVDGSVVTYHWYRFVDQPSFQQYAWGEEKKAKLQAFVEKLHANWPMKCSPVALLRSTNMGCRCRSRPKRPSIW